MRLICPEQKNFSQTGKQILSKHFDCTFLDIDNEKDLNNLISEFDILLIRFKLKISKKTLLNSTKLKFIICPTTGLDHIDLDTIEKLGIKLFSLKNQSTFLRKVPSTAELTILLILTLLRNYNQASKNVKTFLWRSNLERGFELNDKKIGIIGLGRLGRIVSKICYAFGAKIYFFDIDSNINYKKYNRVSSIKELFETTDIVSIHIPLNNHTKNLIDINIFKQKKFKCKFLINTSRGEIINSKSLIYALETQKIKGAGLDVIDKEEKNKELINFSIKNDNLIITPHIGGYTYEAIEKTDKFLINNFLKYINNGKNYN
tara:strand:+ start:5358 stop:6308 length:951 start_codon:yes stop_codon:yes gene_type:complete